MAQTLAPQSFTCAGRTVNLNRAHGDVIVKLNPGVYTLMCNPMTGFYLELQDPTPMPEKVYGDCGPRSDKILNTYMSRTGANTGVLLTGNKGSGKTLLAKTVCHRAVNELNMPVILIEDAYHGTDFLSFINSITQQCCVFIDEFEKKYSKEEYQNSLLGLLDGTGTARKLFLLTSNKADISTFFISRPSRIFYHWQYGKLEEEVMAGYCKDNLKDTRHLGNLMTLWTISNDISFDVMQAMVEEINRYPDLNFVDLITDMNINLGNALNRTFEYDSCIIGNKEIDIRCEQTAVNIVDAYTGKATVRIHVRIDSWPLQKALYKALGKNGSYFYNQNLLNQEEDRVTKGLDPLSDETYERDMDNDFTLILDIDPTTDDVKTDSILINRKIEGTSLEVVMNAVHGDPLTAYFRRLFK